MGVVDKEQWSAGEASAIAEAEVALAKLPVKISFYLEPGIMDGIFRVLVSPVRSTMV